MKRSKRADMLIGERRKMPEIRPNWRSWSEIGANGWERVHSRKIGALEGRHVRSEDGAVQLELPFPK